MKTCKHCKASIPQDAKKCQHCAGDLRNWFLRHWIISSILVLIILATAFGSGGKKAGDTGSSSSSSTTANNAPAEVIKVTAAQLYSAYKANEISADSQYKGKLLEVSGSVNNVGKTFNSPYVALKGDTYFGDIQCMLRDSEQSKAATLQKGQQVTVQGENIGLTLNVTLSDCIIK